ncbi:MAG: DUF695 domain-containing protein [Bacteroidales bacterium]
MKLTDVWFTALSEAENGRMVFISGRDHIMDFIKSGKFKERAEIYWKYEGDSKGMPDDQTAKLMEEVQTALQKAMEKDKLAILTGVYTGDNERTWVFITRNVPAFGDMLNQALADFELLPITIYTEKDPDNEEYLDMYQMKQGAVE